MTDHNGLIYMRNRYYSPILRRFVNADVLHGSISDSTSLNRYAYVNGNPVSFIDPLGLKGWSNWLKVGIGCIVIAGLAVATAVAAPAVAAVAGAALVGATVSGGVGAVFGYIDDGWDGAATGFMTGSVAGAASGALAASTFGATTIGVGNVLIDVGEYALEEAASGTPEEITWDGIIRTAVLSVMLDSGTPGWLNSNGDLFDEKELMDSTLQREARRQNQEYAEKQIARSINYFNDAAAEKILEYGKDTFFDGIKKEVNKRDLKKPQETFTDLIDGCVSINGSGIKNNINTVKKNRWK